MYHELVYHLDLCMLSYHLHAQTLIWPTDPYLEQVATKSTSRRENFILNTHNHFDGNNNYHGPGSTQGWPTNKLLDPIMSKYNRLFPWRPVFLGTERRDWLWHNSPRDIIDKIQHCYMQRYYAGNNPVRPVAPPPIPPPRRISSRPASIVNAGTDAIYCFEGGTGVIDRSPASWSLMGFCLVRNNADGTYDVHVTFRGSRSGAAGRAAMAGLQSGSRSVFAVRNRDELGVRQWVVPGTSRHVARGNGDWITDMDFNDTVTDPEFSAYGSVCRGFSASMKTTLPLVISCMEAIHAAKGGPPRTVWVTGHSLGGALAGEFTSAMVCGTTHGPFGSKLPAPLRTWPWQSLRLISMSSPVVGGERFHTTFNSRVYTRRVLLGKDPITMAQRHFHVGSQVLLHETPGSTAGIPYTDHHEPYKVRRSLIFHIKKWGDDLAGVPLVYETDHVDEPWRKYGTFHALLQAHNLAAQIPTMMAEHPTEFAHYLEILQPTMKEKSTHNAGHGGAKVWKPRVSASEKTDYDTKITEALALLRATKAGTLKDWNDCLLGIGGESFSKFLRLNMLIAACVMGVPGNDGGPMNLPAVLSNNALGDI